MYGNKDKIKDLAIFAVDTICLMVSYILANCLWLKVYKGFKTISRTDLMDELGLVLFAFLGTILFFNVNREFYKRGIFAEVMHCTKINLLFAAIEAVFLVIRGDTGFVSRGVFVSTVLLNILFMCLGHCWLRYYLVSVYKYKKKNVQMFVVTTEDRAEKILKNLHKKSEWNNRVRAVAIIDAEMIGQEIAGVPVVADYYGMIDYIRTEPIDEVFINVPYHTGKSLKDIVMQMENMGITVHLNIEVLENFEGFDKQVTMLAGTPVISFSATAFDYNKLIIKRAMDIVGSLVGLVITGVVIIFLAPPLLIESRGPLIFKQKRVGKNGRYFYMYKFRSMYRDAEARKAELMEQNEMNGLMFKMTDDPRVTKVGRFIRRTSIDELPQFWNVLRGDMSLVGTRPPTVDEFQKYEGYHKRRLSTKPGITGMWQVSGRNDIEDFEDVVKLDLEYIDNWCLSLDIKILLKTVGIVFVRKGAK
jgi:exopolysaccharide biosynthesis polyprenyl glycosylphosphotransferase